MIEAFLLLVLFHNVYFVQGMNYGNSVYFLVTYQSFNSVLYNNSKPIISFKGIGYLYEYNGSLIVLDNEGDSLSIFISRNGANFTERTLVSNGLIEGVPLFSSGYVVTINNGYLQVFDVYSGKEILNESFIGEPLAFYYPDLIYGYISGNGVQAYEYDVATNTSTYLGDLKGVGFTPNGTLVEINGSEIAVGDQRIPVTVFPGGSNYVQEGYYNRSLYFLVSSTFDNRTEIELIRVGGKGGVEYSGVIPGTYIPTSIVFEDGRPYGVFIDVSSASGIEVPLYSQAPSSPSQSPISIPYDIILAVLIIVVVVGVLIRRLRS